jgi:hypothetical protein
MKAIPPRKGKVHFVDSDECYHNVVTRCGLPDKTGTRASRNWDQVTCENCRKTDNGFDLTPFGGGFFRGVTNIFSGKHWNTPPNHHARYNDTPGWAERDKHNLPAVCLMVGDREWIDSRDGFYDDELLCGLFASECFSYPDNPEDEYFDYTTDQSEVTCPSCKYILNKLD